MGYMLPNLTEMVSSEDGFVTDPVHLAMCFGFGEWSEDSGMACGAEAVSVGSCAHANEGAWLCAAKGPAGHPAEVLRFGQVTVNGALHRKDLSLAFKFGAVARSSDLSEQLQYALTWQSACPMVISTEGARDPYNQLSSRVWSGENMNTFTAKDSRWDDSPASLTDLSLCTIGLLQDKCNHMSSPGIHLSLIHI